MSLWGGAYRGLADVPPVLYLVSRMHRLPVLGKGQGSIFAHILGVHCVVADQ